MKPLLDFFIIAAGVAAGFVVVLWTGFRLHDQPAPSPIGTLFPAAVVVLGVAVARLFLIIATQGWRGSPIVAHRLRRESQREYGKWKRDQEEQLARLDADPTRCRYADRIRRGESWSDAQIDYDLDPDLLVTCDHLAPIERDMRRSDLWMKRTNDHSVEAWCTIDGPELDRRYATQPPVWHGIVPQFGRSFEDPPSALIRCEEHASIIHVVAPGQADRDTPRFPAS